TGTARHPLDRTRELGSHHSGRGSTDQKLGGENQPRGQRSSLAVRARIIGTPLENRLDELYSVVQFIDDRRLGPAFRFYNRHRVVDEKGKVLGYKNLAELRENLQPVLLRRTRQSVRQQLPLRTSEIVRITPTQEQLELHRSHMRLVNRITRKKFLT